MYNRFYPLITQFDGNDLDNNVVNSTAQKEENESNKYRKNGGNNKLINRIKQSQHISSKSNNQQIFSFSTRKNDQQPDWQHILDRIKTYAQGFPTCDEEGVVHLQQGLHFIFCDQFVNTIRYGAELFQGMIVRNFIDCSNGFFNELFKHVVKTQYPEKFIPLVSFSLDHSFSWPQCGLLVEIPRHLEPKVLRKGENNSKVIVTLSSTSQLINNFITHVQVQRKGSNAQRVMYSLQNEKTSELFYLKIWFDPAQGDEKYKHMKGLTLRAGKTTTMAFGSAGRVVSSST